MIFNFFAFYLRRKSSGLQVLPRNSLQWPGSSAPPSGFWRWSWPCGLDLPGTDPGETITLNWITKIKITTTHYTKQNSLQSDLQVPLDLADVVLQQEVVLQGEAAVLVVQLSQEVVEPNCCQRVLHRHRFPEEGHSNIFNREETEKTSHWRSWNTRRFDNLVQ